MSDVGPASCHFGVSERQDCSVMVALVKDQMMRVFSLLASCAFHSGVASYFIRYKFYGRLGKYQCQCQGPIPRGPVFCSGYELHGREDLASELWKSSLCHCFRGPGKDADPSGTSKRYGREGSKVVSALRGAGAQDFHPDKNPDAERRQEILVQGLWNSSHSGVECEGQIAP